MSEYRSGYNNSYALIVGINTYSDPRFMPLGQAESDALSMAELLGQPPYNFTITELLGAQATKSAILQALHQLRRSKADDRVLVYFAGHGYTLSDRLGNEAGYLACADTVPEQDFTALELESVISLTRHAEAKHIGFIFDACFSGQALGLTRAPSVTADKFMQRRAYQVISAGAGDQTVSDYQSMTGMLVEALRTDILMTDGLITMGELGLHLQQTITADSNQTQIPQFGHIRGSQGGDFVFYVDTSVRLPADLEDALRSNRANMRMSGVVELIELATSAEDDLRQVAYDRLVSIAETDADERVREAAQSYFDELEADRETEEARRELERREEEARRRREEARQARDISPASMRKPRPEEIAAGTPAPEPPRQPEPAPPAYLPPAEPKQPAPESTQAASQRIETPTYQQPESPRYQPQTSPQRKPKSNSPIPQPAVWGGVLGVGLIGILSVILIVAVIAPNLNLGASPEGTATSDTADTATSDNTGGETTNSSGSQSGETGGETAGETPGAVEPDGGNNQQAPVDANFVGQTLNSPCVAGSSQIGSIEAVDQFTVRFNLCRSEIAFLEKIALPVFGIQPAEWITSTGGTNDLLDNPVGTGPYQLASWERGQSITLQRFDNYWGVPALTENLLMQWEAESSSRYALLIGGTADGMSNASDDDIENAASNSSLKVYTEPMFNVAYLGLTNTAAPLNDVRVRQAIAMGINRAALAEAAYPSGAEVADYFTPCQIPNGCVGDPWYAYDPEQARALLAEAGYPDGFSINLYFRDVVRGYAPEQGTMIAEIANQLSLLNIEVNSVVMESGAFISEAALGNLEGMHLLGWGADYPHVVNFIGYHFNSAYPQWGDLDATITDPVDAAAVATDPGTEQALYVEANNAIRELVPMVPLVHNGFASIYRGDVQGAYVSPAALENFAEMSNGRDTFSWVMVAEPISLYCGDESDSESLLVCHQIVESLYKFDKNGTAQSALATSCSSNADFTVWTCALRQDAMFHDGSFLDANDVVVTWTALLDASSPLHTGNSGYFDYASVFWGLINP